MPPLKLAVGSQHHFHHYHVLPALVTLGSLSQTSNSLALLKQSHHKLQVFHHFHCSRHDLLTTQLPVQERSHWQMQPHL